MNTGYFYKWNDAIYFLDEIVSHLKILERNFYHPQLVGTTF